MGIGEEASHRVLQGLQLRQRRRHTFCVVMAAIGCAFMPFGTVLGIFTLIVLTKPTVRSLFARA